MDKTLTLPIQPEPLAQGQQETVEGKTSCLAEDPQAVAPLEWERSAKDIPGIPGGYRLDTMSRVAGAELSIQERLFPELRCFGCGPANEAGLRLRSFPGDGFVTARFLPWPEHDNGLGFLNGGIISTVLDCHSAAAVLQEAARRGWHPAPGAGLAYVTAGLDVRYVRPSPLTEACELRAVITSASETEMTAEAELVWEGKVRATATALWKRWIPRT